MESLVIYEGRLLARMEFVEVGVFQKALKSLGCSPEDLRQLQIQLLNNPDAGPVIPGTGSARKMRFAREGRGKSGDLRVIYARFPAYESIALIYAYEKNEQENLTEADKKVIKALLEEIGNVLPLKANGKGKRR